MLRSFNKKLQVKQEVTQDERDNLIGMLYGIQRDIISQWPVNPPDREAAQLLVLEFIFRALQGRITEGKIKGLHILLKSNEKHLLESPIQKAAETLIRYAEQILKKQNESKQESKTFNCAGKMIVMEDKSRKSLFPKKPSLDDIKQGGVGDCFFLSALATILTKTNGSQIIQDMFKEVIIHDELKVQVKFFNPKTGMPYYVLVDKSIPKDPNQHAEGPLWVSILEKAYTLAILNGDYAQLSQSSTIGETLPHLLGEPFSRFNRTRVFNTNREDAFTLASGFDIQKLTILQDKLRLSPQEIVIWKDFIIKHSLQVKWKLLAGQKGWLIDKKNHEINYTHLHVLRREDLRKLVSQPNMSADEENVVKKVLLFADEILPGKRGTGKYSQEEIALYNKIKERVEDQFCVGAGSMHKIKEFNEEKSKETDRFFKKHAHNEEEYKGFAGKHAYAVLGCVEKDGCLYVRLKNPWSIPTGRDYTRVAGQETLAAKKIDCDIFDMELTDFIKRMEFIDEVGTYLTYTKQQGIAYIPTKIPAYVLASDGLYFTAQKEPITKNNLITNKPENLKYLLAFLDVNKLEDQTRLLQIDDKQIILTITESTMAEEKALSEAEGGTIVYTKTAVNVAAMEFERLPAYVLTKNGLYEVTQDETREVKHAQIVSQPVAIQWLWFQLTKQFHPSNNKYILTEDTWLTTHSRENPFFLLYRDKTLIHQVMNNNDYNFDDKVQYDATQFPVIHMKKFNLSPGLINLFINALKMLFEMNNQSPLKTLVDKISPVQIQGLVNLTIRFGHEHDAVQGKCYELAALLNLKQSEAILRTVFPDYFKLNEYSTFEVDPTQWTIFDNPTVNIHFSSATHRQI